MIVEPHDLLELIVDGELLHSPTQVHGWRLRCGRPLS